jgi:hypothetical protein
MAFAALMKENDELKESAYKSSEELKKSQVKFAIFQDKLKVIF